MMSDKCVHECTIGIDYIYDEFMEPLSFSDLCEKCESDIEFIKQFTQATVYDIEDLLFDFIKNFDRRTNKLAIRFSYCPYCGMKIDWANLKYVAKKYVEEMRAEYE